MQSQLKLYLLLLVSTFLMIQNASATNNPWTLIQESQIKGSPHLNRQIIPSKYLTFHLAMEDLQHILDQAPMRFSADASNSKTILQIPMPNGTMERFQIQEAPIMHPGLAKKYPMLRAYAGVGLDDPSATIRFDVTPAGFHGMISSGQHGGVFIDPYAEKDTQHYISYYKKDFNKNVSYICHFEDDEPALSNPGINQAKSLQGDCALRTYRLALACTGEYAQYHGGNTAEVMAAFHTTMTRVNGIFERDAAIHLELIANTDDLIFLDPATDPYNFDFPYENQAVCDDIIGTDNYDLGHVFGVGGGGAAFRSSCCVEGIKADAYSTLSPPVGDAFDVNFVAHEFGHQFGCSHTYNGNCNTTLATSVEPGAASTVMGTDFFCNPIETVRGAYFHAINLLEIAQNVVEGPAGSCAVLTETGNNPPVVEVGETHFFLPVSTPFKLTATGNDLDADVLTYCWEQMNNETVIDPPVSTNPAGPAFRSYDPVDVPYRYFPALEYIVNGTDYAWEVLPGVSRGMDFRVTVRDNFMAGGCTGEDNLGLTFTDRAGPFLVQTPNGGESWYQDAAYTVTWDVANTDRWPVSCELVDILLSIDGGYTYPIVLASGVPNDGAEVILVPQVSTSNARFMIGCSDNVFFDISDQDLSISMAASPSLSLAVDPPAQEVCGIDGPGVFSLFFSALAGFDEEVTLSAMGVPDGVTLDFTQNPVNPQASVDLTLNGLENMASGNYTISLMGTTSSTSVEQSIFLTLENEDPDSINLLTPLNGSIDEQLTPEFTWEAGANTTEYVFEIATSPGFGNTVVEEHIFNTDNYTLTSLLKPLTVYYWRVFPESICSDMAENVPFFSFQTSGSGCREFINLEPEYIQGFINSTTTTITIEEDLDILDVNVSMEIFHKLVGDLITTLTSPAGTSVQLFDRPGVPSTPEGCTRDNLLLSLDDEAGSSAFDLENTCITGTDYAIEGAFNPITPLSAFDGQSTLGVWVLTIEDEKFAHSGAVDNWSLEFCFDNLPGETPDLSKMDVLVPSLGSEVISTANLLATSAALTPDQILYTLLSVPTEGLLLLNGSYLGVGMTFTQDDINNNLLSYTHTNADVLEDQFQFDIQTPDGSWISDQFLDIDVEPTTSVEQPTRLPGFDLFPNPANDYITVTVHEGTPSRLDMLIFAPTGKKLREMHVMHPGSFFQKQIDISDLPSGLYLMYLRTGDSYSIAKFVKI